MNSRAYLRINLFNLCFPTGYDERSVFEVDLCRRATAFALAGRCGVGRSPGILLPLPLPTSLDHYISWYICLFLVYLYPCVFFSPYAFLFKFLPYPVLSICFHLHPSLPPPLAPPSSIPNEQLRIYPPMSLSPPHGINILTEPVVSTPPHGQTQSSDVAFLATRTCSRISWMSVEKWPICKKRRLTSTSRGPGYLASVSAFLP